MKLYIVLMMMNIEYMLKFVLNSVLKDIIKTIWNQEHKQITIVKDNNWSKNDLK